MKHKLYLFLIPFLLLAVGAAAQEADEIMRQVEKANSPETTHALIRMELIDSDGETKERIIEQWGEEQDSVSRSVIVFHRPASVQHTRFLSLENPDRDDDQWIYLPALKRVRRIAASEGEDSFMGTEFSYDDLKSREAEDFRHRITGEGVILDYPCWIIESTPKPETDSNYGRIRHWVTKDPEVRSDLKMELYDEEGRLAKSFIVEKLELIDGYWTPTSAVMLNERNGRATRLIQERLELDRGVNPRRFTTRFLETGRTN